jgi:hypothetical protein
VVSTEPPLAVADLLAEVVRLRGEITVPGEAIDVDHRRVFVLHDAAADGLVPADLRRQPVRNEDLPVADSVVEGPA